MAVEQPTPAPPPSRRMVLTDELKASIGKEAAADVHKRAEAYVRVASKSPSAWTGVCSLLNKAEYWHGIPKYLSKIDPSWSDVPRLLLYAGRAERHLRHASRSVELLERLISLEDSYDARFELAASLFDLDRYADAAAHIVVILEQFGKAKAMTPLLRKLAAKAPDAAINVVAAARVVRSDDIRMIILQGDCFEGAGRFAEACETFREAMTREPDQSGHTVRYMRAAFMSQSDDHLFDAIAAGEAILRHEANHAAAYVLVQLYNRAPSGSETNEALVRISHQFASDAKLLTALAAGFFRNGDLARAETMLARLIDIDGKNVDAVYLLAGVLGQQSRVEEALALIHAKIAPANRDGTFFARVGHFLAWAGDFQAAMAALQKSIDMDNLNSLAIADLALCYEMTNQLSTAASLMNQSILAAAIRPPKFVMGIEQMHPRRLRRRLLQVMHMTGNSDYARSISAEVRREERMVLPYPIREWEDGSFAGLRVMAVTQSGVGDEIRFTSVFDRHFAKAAAVSVTCDPRLETIFSRSFPKYKFYPAQRTFPRLKKTRADQRRLAVSANIRSLVSDAAVNAGEHADIWTRTMDLFETVSFGRSDVAIGPTLKPDPEKQRAFRFALAQKSGGRPVIGLSWRGGHHSYSRDVHYFDIDDWGPILDVPGYCFVNLQYSLRDDELMRLRARLGDRFIEFPDLDLMDDMEGIAALCSCLDHVVAVCTSVLELAGAVGAPALYMMRSPQVTHSIRLVGEPDYYGMHADNVWTCCRILPRRMISDKQMVAQALAYLDVALSEARNLRLVENA